MISGPQFERTASQRKWLLMLLLLIAWSPWQLATGQEAEVQDSIDLTPKVVKESELSDFNSNSRKVIQEVQELLEQREGLEEQEQETLFLDTLISDKLLVIADSNTLWRLDQLEKEQNEIRLIRTQVTSFQEELQEASGRGQDLDIQINYFLATWDLTRKWIRDSFNLEAVSIQDRQEYEERLIGTITGLEEELRLARTDLRSFRNFTQKAQTELNVISSGIDKLDPIIQSRINRLVGQIWLPDSPPIWQVFKDTLVPGNKGTSISILVEDHRKALINFSRNYPNLPVYLLSIFALFVGLTFYLKKRKPAFPEEYEEELEPAVVLLKHPFLSGLLVLWFFIELFFSPSREISRLISLFMLVPVLFIYWKLRGHQSWLETFLLFILYMAFLLFLPSRQYPVFQRFFLLFCSTFSFLLIRWFLRIEDIIEHENPIWLGLLPAIGQTFLFFSGLAIIANIIGSVELAQLLTYATLGTSLSIIVISSVIEIIRAFLFMLALGPLQKHSYILREDGATVLSWMKRIISLVTVGLWFYVTLDLLSIRTYVIDTVVSFFNEPLTIGNVSISLWQVISFFLILQIFNWLSKFFRYILEKEVFPRIQLADGVPNTISLMIRFTLAIIGLVFAIGALGIDLEKVAIGIGALGVGIGFGLQQVVNNFLSGIILALERPIKIGDLVDLPEASGRITDIGLRASTIKSWEGADIIVPNGRLLANPLKNWTKSDRRRRLKVDIRVPFESNPEEVGKILVQAAGKHPSVLKRPAPYLHFEGIGSSTMEIKLYFWIPEANDLFTMGTEVRIMVYNALQEAGYELPVPKQDVQVSTIHNSSVEIDIPELAEKKEDKES